MTTKGEATPRPWATDAEFDYQVIIGPDEILVADCSIIHETNCVSDELCAANAALIVEAVNNHDRLTEENRRYREALEKIEKIERHEAFGGTFVTCHSHKIAQEALTGKRVSGEQL